MKSSTVHFRSLSALFFLLVLFIPARTFCQDSTETKEKLKSKIKVEYLKNEANVKMLRATVTSKVEKKWQPVENISVSFYRDSVSPASLMKKVNTGVKGIGLVEVPDNLAQPDSQGLMKFFAAIEVNNDYEEAEETIEVKELDLTNKFLMEDSIAKVIVSATVPEGDKEVPVADLEINVFVKRMFSLLKVASGTTDESGSVEIEIPLDIPGDSRGMLEIIAKVEDHADYGTVAATCGEAQCGIPMMPGGESRSEMRALWSPNAPLWMVITFLVLMTGVWGHFIFIIYTLFRIRGSGEKAIVWD